MLTESDCRHQQDFWANFTPTKSRTSASALRIKKQSAKPFYSFLSNYDVVIYKYFNYSSCLVLGTTGNKYLFIYITGIASMSPKIFFPFTCLYSVKMKKYRAHTKKTFDITRSTDQQNFTSWFGCSTCYPLIVFQKFS